MNKVCQLEILDAKAPGVCYINTMECLTCGWLVPENEKLAAKLEIKNNIKIKKNYSQPIKRT